MKTSILIFFTLIQFPIFAKDAVKAPDEQLRDLPTYPFKPTVRVVGEKGEPISGALVKMGIFNLREKGDYKNFEGATNKKGEFAVDFQAHLPLVPIEVTKDGYYQSRKRYEDSRFSMRDIINHGGFRPLNPTVDVVLKKIGKPIPMCVRFFDNNSGHIFLPGYGEMFQFDVFRWEWLPPHGKGKIADWNLHINKVEDSNGKTYREVLLELSNKDDGMTRIERFSGKESFLVRPRIAPKQGYSIKRINHRSGEPTIVENDMRVGLPRGYFFRLRTLLNKDGTVKSGYYGMILNSDPVTYNPLFEIWSEGNPINKRLTFGVSEIFINPKSLDNNLEWDRKNACKGVDR